MIYDPRVLHNSNSIVCYANANLGGEADSSKSTSGIIIIFALGILVLWRLLKQTLVAQSTMQAEMFPRAYGKVQLGWPQDALIEIDLGADMTRCIFNDGLNYVTTLHSGNFQSEIGHIQLK
jgi:hypothetical protein